MSNQFQLFDQFTFASSKTFLDVRVKVYLLEPVFLSPPNHADHGSDVAFALEFPMGGLNEAI